MVRTPSGFAKLSLAAALVIGALGAGRSAMAQVRIVHVAENRDPQPGPVAEKPYEMARRLEERRPLVAFDDVSGWEVEGSNAEGWLYRTQDRKLYRDHSAKLVCASKGDNPWLMARPAQPIPIPEPWESLNLWTWGNMWGWDAPPERPPVHVLAVVRDSAGQQFDIDLGWIDYDYWFMMHGRLHEDQLAKLKRPCALVGFRFENVTNKQKLALYLGPCYFYHEDLEPLTFAPWPEKLPFPTRPETILPANNTSDFENRVRQEGDATVFSYHGGDCSLDYRYRPNNGTLGDIELSFDGRTLRACAGGGMQLIVAGGAVAPDEPAIERALLDQHLDGDTLVARWRLQAAGASTEFTYRIRIAQKSLIVEMEADQPVVERVALGRAEPVKEGKLFRVPFLTYGGSDPRVLWTDGLFVFTQFDWYYSQASLLQGGGSLGNDWAVYNGGAQYTPKTDGQRNPVRERLFITASPDFQEVLPAIPNPPSPFQEAQGERLWRVKMGSDYPIELAEARKLRSYGCDKVTIRYHEDFWRATGESFTFRLNANPARGGDPALKKFVSDMQALDWRVGLYTNYTDYAPVNSFWDEDMVIRFPNRDWQRAWPRNYAAKPMFGWEMEAKLAPQIQAKFGENHSYCDVHTCVSPFDRVDYDARVPGAATFRRTFECYGLLLYNEKLAHKGPVYSEGTNHWWYAGLTDGNYGQINSAAPSAEPLLVDFDLLKMHPLEMDAGMGAPEMFFRDHPRDLDQFIATTLAYGHIGFFDWQDLPGMLKIYYMMQQIQKRYAMVPVKRVEYEDNGKLVDTSQALVSGAYRNGRMHVVYENGTEVWVNGSQDPWVVSTGGEDTELPAWGYAAVGPFVGESGTAIAYSAVLPVTAQGEGAIEGPRRRTDLSDGPAYTYMDSRGGFAFALSVGVEGSGVLRKDGGQWWVIPTTEFRDFAFYPSGADIHGDMDVEVTAVAEDRSPAPAPELRWSRDMLHLIPTSPQAFKYLVCKGDSRREGLLSCDTVIAVPGTRVEVTLPKAGADALLSQAFWECDGKRLPAEVTAGEGLFTCAVPKGLREGAHLWLGVPTSGRTLWVDFIVANPCQVEMEMPARSELRKGEPLQAAVLLTGNQEGETSVRVDLSVSGAASCQPGQQEVMLAGGESASLPVAVSLPWQSGDYDFSASAICGGRRVVTGVGLAAELIHPVLADLTDSSVPYVKGYCLRGGKETYGGESVYDGMFLPSQDSSGGVTKACLFAHPPWGERGVGYSFAVYELKLPESMPIRFEFFMGMRDGHAPTDGVTYKVLVVDQSGKEHQLFSHHHQEFRWDFARVDLSAFAGQAVKLKLIADCGPADDTNCDHALWGEPKVVLYGEDQARLRVRRVGSVSKVERE